MRSLGRFQVGFPWPFNWLARPSVHIEVFEHEIVFQKGLTRNVQPINCTTRVSGRSALLGNTLCVDANCDRKAGPFTETVYDNVIGYPAFCEAVGEAQWNAQKQGS